MSWRSFVRGVPMVRSLGARTTLAYGDKIIGMNHRLSRMRIVRSGSELWVGGLLKTCAYPRRLTGEASVLIGGYALRRRMMKGFAGHLEPVNIRLRRFGSRNLASVSP